MNDLSGAVWRKSTRSNSSSNSCVEVALMPDGGAAIRDGKLDGSSPILRFTKSDWTAFTTGVIDGEFSTPDPKPGLSSLRAEDPQRSVPPTTP